MENGAWTATFFYAEADGRPEDRGLALAFEELSFFAEKFEILGVYSADPFRTRGKGLSLNAEGGERQRGWCGAAGSSADSAFWPTLPHPTSASPRPPSPL